MRNSANWNDRKLIALLVGKSGDGKSEFIRSFMAEEHRCRVPSSGEGQTTRCSMVYTLHFNDDIQYRAHVRFKTREVFVGEAIGRMKCRDILHYNTPARLRQLRNTLINSTAYFSVTEFKLKSIQNEFEEIFTTDFIDSFQQNSAGDSLISSDRLPERLRTHIGQYCTDNGEVVRQFNFIDCLSGFMKYVYDECNKIITDFFQGKNIKNENGIYDLTCLSSEELELFLKTREGEISFSAFVDELRITAKIRKEYHHQLQSIGYKEIQLIDTYGLDHGEQVNVSDIEKRYRYLLGIEFKEVNTVFFIRNLNATTSFSDLEAIPPIFNIRPDIMPYVILTHTDEFLSKKQQQVDDTLGKIERLPCIQESKCYKALKNENGELYDNIEVLLEGKLPTDYVRYRLGIIRDNVILYSSKTSWKYSDLPAQQYFIKSNLEQIYKLFKLIKRKEYLGTLYLNMNSLNKLKITSVNIFFGLASDTKQYLLSDFQDDPARTKGALSERLQHGILGFQSTSDFAIDSYWSIKFSRIIQYGIRKWINAITLDNFLCSTNDQMMEALQTLLEEYGGAILDCPMYGKLTDNMNRCVGCQTTNNCIQSIMYNDKKKIIENKKYPVYQWLNDIYDFSRTSEEQTFGKLQTNVFDRVYKQFFLTECRKHNARVLADQLDATATMEDIDKKIKTYFSEYDSQLSDDGKKTFRMLVNQELSLEY